MFIDEDFDLLPGLRPEWAAIREECLALPANNFEPWVQREMYGQGWSVYGLVAFGGGNHVDRLGRGSDKIGPVQIRDAKVEDWPQIWAFMRPIVAAGETFTWDRDVTEPRARSMWMGGRAFVAVDEDGTVLGTAEIHRNQGGGGAHVANAGFMVAPAAEGKGVGRALCLHALAQARLMGYSSMQFNAVVETNVRAVRLWQSLGFEILATVPEAFQHPTKGLVGLHIMYRRL